MGSNARKRLATSSDVVLVDEERRPATTHVMRVSSHDEETTAPDRGSSVNFAFRAQSSRSQRWSRGEADFSGDWASAHHSEWTIWPKTAATSDKHECLGA
ncbi:MAG: hypothetical protein MHM6MM_004905, partial [Cercozoa sp. M6MM]